MPSLAEVIAADNLYRAFEHVRDADERDGYRSHGLREFLTDPAQHLAQLRDELADGTFRPEPLVTFSIPKPGGGRRTLGIPPFRDRVVERALHQALTPAIDGNLSPASFAYRPGLGVGDAVAEVVRLRDAGGTWAVRTDFRNCFDEINHAVLADVVATHVPQPALRKLIAMLVSRDRVHQGVRFPASAGTPQGSALSPLLSNLYLDVFDRLMERKGHRLVRYADDVTVVCRNEEEAKMAEADAREAAAVLDLELNEEKTYHAPFADGIELLGVRVDQRTRRGGDMRPVPKKKAVYVSRQGAWVYVSRGQLRIDHDDEQLLEVPFAHVGQLVLFGSVNMSSAVRYEALRRDVDVIFLSRRGRYLGRLVAAQDRDPERVLQQYRMVHDESFRLRLARQFVVGKIRNCRALLQRRARSSDLVVGDAVESLDTLRKQAERATALDQLLGFEGAAAKAYFAALAAHLPGTGFEGRQRRPPPDPVNAALSFGYVMLTNELISACHAAGLDPYLGFLHSQPGAQPSLALDLAEEFRPLVVDTVVVEAFGRGTLAPADFRPARQGGGVHLGDVARRRFLEAYEERLLTVAYHLPSRTSISYRRALFLQARQIAGIIEGDLGIYQPVTWR